MDSYYMGLQHPPYLFSIDQLRPIIGRMSRLSYAMLHWKALGPAGGTERSAAGDHFGLASAAAAAGGL